MDTNTFSECAVLLKLQADALNTGGFPAAAGAVSLLGTALSDVAECGCAQCFDCVATRRHLADLELAKLGAHLSFDDAMLEPQ